MSPSERMQQFYKNHKYFKERYEITLSDNNELLLSYLKTSNKKMKAVTKDVFSCAVGTVYIQRDETTAVSGFLLSTGRIRNLAFHRLCDRSRSPS